jgi:hypothetical protein
LIVTSNGKAYPCHIFKPEGRKWWVYFVWSNNVDEYIVVDNIGNEEISHNNNSGGELCDK